jgi:uncharacterized protein (TIGR02145 family)
MNNEQRMLKFYKSLHLESYCSLRRKEIKVLSGMNRINYYFYTSLKSIAMKKYYFFIAILFFGLLSCSKEETKTQNQEASRPTVPITAPEVQIGTQVWMTKNLNVSRYRNGDPIPQVNNPTQWANLTTGAWCYYNNNSANGLVYGKLYNWYAVNDSRGLAPVGWHVPSDVEWTMLVTFLDGESFAGSKLKSITLWTNPNTGATNSSGFTGIPGGFRNELGTFFNILNFGFWWSRIDGGTTTAWNRCLIYNNSAVCGGFNYKLDGFSVRCLRD